MQISFLDKEVEFQPWRPALGEVFDRTFAFDCETTAIDEERRWLTPAYVLGAAFDGQSGYFVPREHAAGFLAAHRRRAMVFHNAPFDLSVLHLLDQKADIYGRVDRKGVWDTQILHRLLMLGTEGHVASGKGGSTLDHCAKQYLGIELPKDVLDAKGQPVRLSYGQYLNCPPSEIPAAYLEYLAKDVVATYRVYGKLRRRLQDLLAGAQDVWGFVSPRWLGEQLRQWGPQTHHIQLRAAIVLREITANGLHLDRARTSELKERLEVRLAQQHEHLREHHYIPVGKGSGQALQAILQRLERTYPDYNFPRTETGKYSMSSDALQDLRDTIPFIALLLEFRETQKLLSSCVKKMDVAVLHPSFNPLNRSGRTTSFGEINAQNLPADDGIRACIVPSPGHVFLDADYKTIEMATLAQACISQFGLESAMARAINSGEDLHQLVAARMVRKSPTEVTKDERQRAKAINFGKPGGMGSRRLRDYAKTSYGVELTDEEVEALSDAWFEQFPEMRPFLADTTNGCLEVATLLDLTPLAHWKATSDRRFLWRSERDGLEDSPSPILGGMFLKSISEQQPETARGIPYPDTDIAFFWDRLRANRNLLPPKLQERVEGRSPSLQLKQQLLGLIGREPVFTLTGRLRANANYSVRHNTVFQGLAADGAKLALWRLWRAGYRIANFVHDQVLVEVPADDDLNVHAQTIRAHLIAGMQEVVPDVRIDVNYAAMDRWYKDAQAVFDQEGNLVPWSPTVATADSVPDTIASDEWCPLVRKP